MQAISQETAQRFESLLNDNQRLLTPALVEELRQISFLRARTGALARPSELHLDTPVNRLCVQDENRIIDGPNDALYRRLRIHDHPTLETLLGVLRSSRERSEAPLRPDVIYAALVSTLGRERNARAGLADEPILWMGTGYHAPNKILVGSHIPRLFDGIVPVLRRTDTLSRAYLALGAGSQPRDEHWARFFEHVSNSLNNDFPASAHDRRVLMEAYFHRSSAGLPEGLNEDACCLLDREGHLWSLSNLRAGLFVESDYPALADALAIAGSMVRIADVTERSRVFFHSLGIRLLTSLAGVGTPVFGDSIPAPLWFKPHHRDLLLAMLRRPLFCRALHELSVHQRHLTLGFDPVSCAELGRRIEGIAGLDFLDAIVREYRVGAQTARVPVEAGVRDGIIGLVKPRTKLDFQQLVAQALAEVAGADNVASARTLSTAFLPLVLCRTAEDMRVYMERMGVDMRGWSNERNDEFALDDDREDAGEEILRQVLQGLDTATRERHETPSISSTATSLGGTSTVQPWPTTPPAAAPPPLAPPIFALPDLGEVTMTITPANERPVQSRVTQGGWSGGSYGRWTPRSPAQAERDQDVGRRGEELVYRMEIERVRAMGYERPEDLVVWASQADPGADHDIKSVGEDNHVRWIEVKSTTGTDGRFEWSRKEFEKALREGDRYELWRVYLVTTTNPVAKRFVNPAVLLGASRLVLELGSLRACLEGLS